MPRRVFQQHRLRHRVRRRLQNALFGGEGLFLTTLTGPGTVYLQSLPFARLADRIVAGELANRGESEGPAGTGVLGDLISGN